MPAGSREPVSVGMSFQTTKRREAVPSTCGNEYAVFSPVERDSISLDDVIVFHLQGTNNANQVTLNCWFGFVVWIWIGTRVLVEVKWETAPNHLKIRTLHLRFFFFWKGRT